MKAEGSAFPGLEVRGLWARAGELDVVADVSFQVEPGQQLCVIGPSGAGKTSLLRAVAGLLPPHRGEVSFAGSSWSRPGGAWVPPERRRIGMLAQDLALWPHMTAREHLLFTLACRGFPRRGRTEEAARLLGLVALGGMESRRPSQLSGGEAQRLALARALAGGSRLLLWDEPMGQLDIGLRRRLSVEMARLARDAGAAMLHVTHDPEDALNVADRVAVLEEGRLTQIGTPRELHRAPATAFVARVTGYTTLVPQASASALLSALGLAEGEEPFPRIEDGTLALLPDHLVPAGRGAQGRVQRPVFLAGRWVAEVEALGLSFLVPGLEGAAPGRQVFLAAAPAARRG